MRLVVKTFFPPTVHVLVLPGDQNSLYEDVESEGRCTDNRLQHLEVLVLIRFLSKLQMIVFSCRTKHLRLMTEDRCGEQQSSKCKKTLSIAELTVSENGDVFVANVKESCPFFWPWQVSLQSNMHHYCSVEQL